MYRFDGFITCVITFYENQFQQCYTNSNKIFLFLKVISISSFKWYW
jgi:hypothetical protein